MALRSALIAKILVAIERSPFTVADFEIVTENLPLPMLLKITFRHDDRYEFAVKETESKGAHTVEAPGDHMRVENTSLRTPDDIPDRVTAWARNVRDELRTVVPLYADLDEMRDMLEKHIKETMDRPESPFSREEAEDMRSKLDKLVEQFRDLQERNELTEQELNRLNQEIVSIKANLVAYPKGIWYKTAANKLWVVMNKIVTSKESREVLAKAAQKALGLDP